MQFSFFLGVSEVFVLLLLLAFPQSSPDRAIASSEAAYQRYFDSRRAGVALVETQTGDGNGETGSAMVLSASPDRVLLLTALHVLKDARRITVTFYLNRPSQYRATLLSRRSDSLDLAILQVVADTGHQLPIGFPAYQFVDNNSLRSTAQIYSINGDGVLVPNRISRLSHDGDAQRLEYTNISVGEGFSGGPVFNTYGNVIGIHDALDPQGHFSIAIKIDSALQTLEALGFSVPRAGPPSSAEYTQAILGTKSDPPTTVSNSTPIQPQEPSPAVPCESGCSVDFSTLKIVRQYRSPQATDSIFERVENVYRLPDSWPGPHYLHSFTMLDRRTNTPLGASSGLLNFIAYLSATDRAGDQDCALPSSGGVCRDSTGIWNYKILGAPGAQPDTIEIIPRRLHH